MERFNCPDLLTAKTHASTRAPNLDRAHADNSTSHTAGHCCGGVRPVLVEGNQEFIRARLHAKLLRDCSRRHTCERSPFAFGQSSPQHFARGRV